MVRFINTPNTCTDLLNAKPTRKSNAGEALRLVNACTPCNGPCHGLSANAMWTEYCATCPLRGSKEAA
jgi:hypothetical protein